MDGVIDNLISNSTFPLLTAFLLGLLTIISPCPFCSDITAVGYIGKDVSSKVTILRNGVCYAMGKVVTYCGLSFIFILGEDVQPVQSFLERYGEWVLGPFFIICAVLILVFSVREKRHHQCHCGCDHQCHCGDSQQCHCGESHHHNNRSIIDKITQCIPDNSGIGAFFIGLIGSLAFCPYTGVIYFGILIPLTISQPIMWNWMIPLFFSIATAIPVLLITILFVYSAVRISHINAHIHKIEGFLRYFCVSIFLCVGIYLTYSIYGGHHLEHDGHHIENIHHNI